MNSIQKRFLLFLGGCITTRAFFVWIAKHAKPDTLVYLGYAALLPAIGFFYIWFTGIRNTGAEVFGDKIWWNSLRPVHGLLYLLFAYSAIQKQAHAWKYLFVDVILGLFSFLFFHYRAGDFSKLF